MNRAQVVVHRWAGLVLGLLLVVECTSGAVLLYHGEIFRATHGGLYHHTSGEAIGVDRALATVDRAHPSFEASWVHRDSGVYVVGNADYGQLYFLDPATGDVNGSADLDRGVMGFLVNLHDCGLGCEGYPAYVGWLAAPVGWPLGLEEVTRGGLVLAVLGLLMILLVATSLRIWWPGWRRLPSRAQVRTGRGRFARDYDLHNVVGAVALPFLLLWGVTGAAFELPAVEKAWLTITGGSTAAEPDFSLTPHRAAKGTPQISTAAAVRAAHDAVAGEQRVAGVYRPTEDTPFYEIDLVSPYAAYAHRAVYQGDEYVLVDPHDASHLKVLESGEGRLSNRLYDKVFEPSHFGWNVNAWWRVLWFAFGIAPLVLLVTGVSTWLFRRGVRQRRRAAGRARIPDAELTGALDREADDDPAVRR